MADLALKKQNVKRGEREAAVTNVMGSVPHDGEMEVWSQVIAERGLAFEEEDYWKVKSTEDLDLDDLILYQIEEITYEEDSPQLEALENALSCMTVQGMTLVYLILGEKGRVRFYFGVARDYLAVQGESGTVKEIGDAFLKPALEGNFRGSIVRELDDGADKPEEKREILSALKKYLGKPKNCRVLYGVPGSVKDKENRDFRGVDRLVDIMQGDDFGLMVLAKPIHPQDLAALRRDVFQAYEMLSAASKQSIQVGVNESDSRNLTVNIGKSISKSDTKTHGVSRNESRATGTTEKRSTSSRFSDSDTKTVGGGDSESTAKGRTESENVGKSASEGQNRGTSVTVSSDLTNKIAADWVKYFDDVIVPRLDYARGKGAYVVTTTLFGANPNIVRKLSQAARSIFAGEMANMVPLLSRIPCATECKQLENLTVPYHQLKDDAEGKARIPYAKAGLLEYSGLARVEHGNGVEPDPVAYSGNWMSVRELALMAGLPQKEVVGMRLKEEVEFGLNVPEDNRAGVPQVELGDLVKSGGICRNCKVGVAQDQLDRHVFVAGVTGSGKTTTCQTLLLATKTEDGKDTWPFLVIEPAKTEYRGLKFPYASKDDKGKDVMRDARCPDLLVFTLGDDTAAPFRLNPFELIPGESVTARVDMLMASLTAAFDMEAAIPQLIERAIYACYEDYGWSIDTNRNVNYEDPFADGVFAFPTLSDVLRKTETVVDEQGFDERLKKDYIGSINARLQGLTLGAKGFMLDCPRSVDFMELIKRKVVLELEPIPNAAQKSLVIGFILTNLLQAVKRTYQTTNRKVNHITLIEEAHRLLSKSEPGGNPSQKQAAETFADMLAEIRKYGESLVIADQIPSKLTPEVMKNTNTKIIHRLFAQDDKEAVGHTMGLEEDQAKFLSNLQIGRAVVFNGNWPKAIQVQITQAFRTDAKIPKDEAKVIRDAALRFYAEHAARGVFGMSHLLKMPTERQLEKSAETLAMMTRLFRRNGDAVATAWSPMVIPDLVRDHGEDVVAEILSALGVHEELLQIVDANRKTSPKDIQIANLQALAKRFSPALVWQVLSRRILTHDVSVAKQEAFLEVFNLLSSFTATQYDKNPDEARKRVSALLSQLRNKN